MKGKLKNPIVNHIIKEEEIVKETKKETINMKTIGIKNLIILKEIIPLTINIQERTHINNTITITTTIATIKTITKKIEITNKILIIIQEVDQEIQEISTLKNPINKILANFMEINNQNIMDEMTMTHNTNNHLLLKNFSIKTMEVIARISVILKHPIKRFKKTNLTVNILITNNKKFLNRDIK